MTMGGILLKRCALHWPPTLLHLILRVIMQVIMIMQSTTMLTLVVKTIMKLRIKAIRIMTTMALFSL